jgi:CRISPR/Cas system CMR subunit Cmr4 (Cas7 group RAMP superfamily)
MNYKIEFFDYWHLSSGASAGPALDALVVKDEFGLPYVPGKTIKGLLKEMVSHLDKQKVKKIFGDEGEEIATSFFSNATLDDATRNYLNKNQQLRKNLYSKVTSTKIGNNGVAQSKTLREVEVVIPLILVGIIHTDEEELLSKAMMMIKQIGMNRNRGLGRCEIGAIQ